MLWASILGTLSCSALLVTSLSAFHDGDVRPCKEGDLGFFATLIAEEGRVFTFLTTHFPPSSDNVMCVLAPDALIQVKSNASKQMSR